MLSRHRKNRSRKSAGYSLIELLVASGITVVVIAAVMLFVVRMQRQTMAAEANTAAMAQVQLLMQNFRKSFLMKVNGDDIACPLAVPPSGAYCRGSCTSGKNECKTVTIRRGVLSDYEDVSFSNACVDAPAGLKKRISGKTLPSNCGQVCGAGKIPVVTTVARRVVNNVQIKSRTQVFPPQAVLSGTGKATSLTNAIGAELCISVDDTTFNPGVVTVSVRGHYLGLGEENAENLQFVDLMQAMEEVTLQNSDVTFMPGP